jgi:two-component system chemotaxis response regulator CheY
MPNMTGLELLKAVRADAAVSAAPFLMVTVLSLQENVIAAVKAGVSNYIIKPFTVKVLGDKVAKIVEKKGQKY